METNKTVSGEAWDFKTGNVPQVPNRLSDDGLALLNQMMFLKGVKTLGELSAQIGVSQIGLQEWLNRGEDLLLSRDEQDKLFVHIGFNPEKSRFGSDRVHVVELHRPIWGYVGKRDELLNAVLTHVVEKGNVFQVCELVSRAGDAGGKLFKQVRCYALRSQDGEQRILLKVHAATQAMAQYPKSCMDMLPLDATESMKRITVTDPHNLTLNEFDDLFNLGERRSSFEDVERYCRALNISPDMLMTALRNEVTKKWFQQNDLNNDAVLEHKVDTGQQLQENVASPSASSDLKERTMQAIKVSKTDTKPHPSRKTGEPSKQVKQHENHPVKKAGAVEQEAVVDATTHNAKKKRGSRGRGRNKSAVKQTSQH